MSGTPPGGKITAASFCEQVVPILDDYLKQHPELRFIQDNAPVHSARRTQEELEMRGITPLRWPPSSLDLNPIETAWQLIKQCLRARPTPPRTVFRPSCGRDQKNGCQPHTSKSSVENMFRGLSAPRKWWCVSTTMVLFLEQLS